MREGEGGEAGRGRRNEGKERRKDRLPFDINNLD